MTFNSVSNNSFSVASQYVDRGWSVVPIPPKSKGPKIPGWQNLRLTTDDLTRHFKRNANIGVILGEPSAWLVDVDLDHPLAVELAPQFLPATNAVFGRDGKRNSHWLYVAEGAKTHQRKGDKHGMLVELRSTGGQTVMPGSVHPSGEQVRWDREGEPAVVSAEEIRRAVDDLADEVLRRLGIEPVRASATAKARTSSPAAGNEIPAGQRNSALVSLAGTMRRVGMTENEILAALRITNENRCAPPLSDSEVESIARSVANYEPNRIATSKVEHHIARHEPFPVDTLPSPIGRYVHEATKAIGCDPSFVALPLLASLASAIGNSRRIMLKPGWFEPCILWTAIVAESGQHKTPALSVATQFLSREQNTALVEYEAALADYRQAMCRYDDDMQAWKKKREGDRPTKPDEPVARRYIVSDTTIEALACVLRHAPRGVLLERDELAGWLNSFDQYKGGKGGDTAHWLTLFNAKPLRIDRKTGVEIYLNVVDGV
jgi:hypothetical protein